MWPRPPDKPNFKNHPRFSRLNIAKETLAPGEVFTAFHSAQNFTRFYGTVACDQPLEVTFAFSNDEVTDDGDWVTDENMSSLHYDGEALRQAYDPTKQAATGKYFVTIYGRWIRAEIKNVSTKPTTWMRVYARGSVF